MSESLHFTVDTILLFSILIC